MNWELYHQALLALLIWREARGEGRDGMRAVAHVVRNRVQAIHLPDSWDDIMAAPWQFSSLTARGDSQLIVWPKAPDAAFDEAMQIASLVYTGDDYDLTQGSTHYFNPEVVLPSWAAKLKFVVRIGHHDFYE